MDDITIGVVVIAKDEADRIGRLLKSVDFADEIVVVDSGSTDDTRHICRDAGARVVSRPWQGFVAQKQIALALATSDWVLNLDADEEVTPELAREALAAVRGAPEDVHGYDMPRLSRYLGRWIRHGGWYPDRKLRLVRRGCAQWTGTDLHERLVVDGRVGRLTAPLHHHVYRSISDQVQTIDRYSGIQAAARGPSTPVHVVLGVVHALGKFLECYLWKGGLRDGIPGLIIAMNSSWYVFLKHAKAWERGQVSNFNNSDNF
jgi:glycosyltransferase involved in cell wall biosynthesis